jgi:hypothetical protein
VKRHQTVEEVKAEFIRVFPEGTGELFYELWSDMAHLQLDWQNYQSLYGTSPERIDLLSWAAPLFFALLDGILFHDIILAIARITDPATTGKFENASLENLLTKLEPHLESDLARQFYKSLSDLSELCKLVRDHRDKIIAHNDLDIALRYRDDPLAGISRAHIDSILGKIKTLMGDIEEQFRGIPTSYYHVFALNDGETLIHVLENARERKKRERNLPSNTDPPAKGGIVAGEAGNMRRKWFSKNFLTLILALATLIYAFLTFFILWEYKRQTGTAYEILEEAKKQTEIANRPYVGVGQFAVDTYPHEINFAVDIINAGKSPATDVRIEYDWVPVYEDWWLSTNKDGESVRIERKKVEHLFLGAPTTVFPSQIVVDRFTIGYNHDLDYWVKKYKEIAVVITIYYRGLEPKDFEDYYRSEVKIKYWPSTKEWNADHSEAH